MKDPELGQFAQVFQADLAKIGVKLNLRQLETGTFAQQSGPPRIMKGLSTQSKQAQLQASTAFMGQDDFKVDAALIAQVAKEVDPAKRKAILQQLNDKIIDESIDMPIGMNQRAQVSTPRVHGMRRPPTNITIFTDTWLG